MTSGDGIAVALSVLGAVLFGLAAVSHHGAVQQTLARDAGGLRQTVASFWRLVRHPAWLVGSGQVVVASGLHIVALSLAPITLVQPIGVLAVPVTVVAAAVKTRRRPSWPQVVGSLLSVVGVVVLTVLLLKPATQPLLLPSWVKLGMTVALVCASAIVAIVCSARTRPVVRCITLATTAAVLFGLNSILTRTIGHVFVQGLVADRLVLVAAAAGIAVALPIGLWAMQTAYVSGSPHVVICCLTLIDPLAAVAGGAWLLNDGMVMTTFTVVAGAACALLAAVGVVFLSRDYPDEALEALAGGDHEPAVTRLL